MTQVVNADAAPPLSAASKNGHNSDGPPLSAERRGGAAPAAGRKFEKPVAWLLGRQLLGSIKGILLYTAYGKKLDPRDWMQAAAADFRGPGPEGAGDRLWRERGGFWFDYISDTGDGMRATYSIAYLCLSDLHLPTHDPRKLRAGQPVALERTANSATLPRGQFLFVGGDTAYHAADYTTLANLIQRPFNWAHADLVRDGRLAPDEPPRPLFGIPGNHDYYDQLDGFRRQFRRPVKWEPRPPAGQHGDWRDRKPDLTADTAHLIVSGFYRAQQASYVALSLPFGWWLWGLDTEVGQIDDRQKEFFRLSCKEVEGRHDLVSPPPKLVVATCSPTTFFGKLADPADYKSADAFGQLGIEQPFLPENVRESRRADGTYDLSTSGDARLKPGQCRLDLSGDVHHYARYWGPPPPAGSLPTRPRARAEADAPDAHSYASVVSGIGGAFHHPSETYAAEVREQSLYPSEATSTAEVARRIFKFWNIWGGGYVWLAGLLISLIVYFAFTVPQSSRQFLNNLPRLGLGLARSERINPTVLRVPEGDERARMMGAPVGAVLASASTEEVTPLPSRLGLGGKWRPGEPPCGAGEPRYFYGPCRVEAPWDFWVGLGLALVAAAPLLLGTFLKRLYGVEAGTGEPGEEVVEGAAGEGSAGADAKPSRVVETAEGNQIKPTRADPEFYAKPDTKLWALTVLAALLFFVGLAMIKPYRAHITPFGNSLLVLLTFVWAGAAAALGLRYSEFLFKKSHRDYIRWFDWSLPWVLTALGVVAVVLGLWSFGRNNLAALLIADALFVAVVLGALGGLLYLPFLGGSLLLWKRGRAARIGGGLLIGLWHFVLQLAVPFVLVRKGNLLALVGVAALVGLGTWLGQRLLARQQRGRLALAWVLLGAATLALPFLTSLPAVKGLSGSEAWAALTHQPFASGDWAGWAGLWPSLLAGAVGAVMCCYWFGWYLGVCFALNGHNNEVGGAARIERFKQFIRFRLSDEGLTGYVIGVNEPEEDGARLKPHLIDVFHLSPKPGAGGA